MRLLMVHYAGDYRQTVQRFAAGEDETYYAQKYSVDAVADIAARIEQVSVLCCMTDEQYREKLPNGVCAIGAGFQYPKMDVSRLLRLIAEEKPTHLTIHTPIKEVFDWAIRNRVRAIGLLADSFSAKGLYSKIWTSFFAKSLNHQQIDWVGNHGINASRNLEMIGVKSQKIIPWDFMPPTTPEALPPKELPLKKDVWRLFYVGAVIETKGFGDVLTAVAQLNAKQLPLRLKVAGQGDLESFRAQAEKLGIAEFVEFLGLTPNSRVRQLMRESDLVVIPSHHEYPEGFPFTIYETLCSRTPLVVSDHPMFKNNLKDGVNCLMFPQKDGIALSQAIDQLLSNPDLYAQFSQASYTAWKNLQIPVKWAEFINRWLQDSPEDQRWLSEHCLASGRY